MKSSVNKGFITYLMLFLGIILGIVMVVGLIMFFSPGTEVLGYVYYTENINTSINSVDGLDIGGYQSVILDEEGNVVPAESSANDSPVTFGSMNKIIIETNGMNVHFIHGQEDRIDVIRNVNGFMKFENVKDFVLTKNYNTVSNVFTIKTEEIYPDLTLTSNSAIVVYIANPTPNLAVEVKTTFAPINVAVTAFNSQMTKDLTLKSLNFQTGTGNILVGEKAKVNNFVSFKVENAKIEIKGQLQASQISQLQYAYFEVAGNGDVTTENLFATLTTFVGETAFVRTGNISGNVNFHVVRGEIVAGDIAGNFVDLEEVVKQTKITLKEVAGEFVIPAAEGSNITVNKVAGNVSVTTTTGNVTIKQVDFYTSIQTTIGNVQILVSDVNQSQINVQTERGNITALFNSVLGSKSLTSTNDGSITVIYKTGLVFKLVAETTKTITLVHEDKTETGTTITGYPTTVDPEFLNDNILNLKTVNGNISVDTKVSVIWDLIS